MSQGSFDLKQFYDLTMDKMVPITICTIYIILCTIVKLRRSGNVCSAKRRLNGQLFWFSVWHNALLAIYSSITFYSFAGIAWSVFKVAWITGSPAARVSRVADLLCCLDGSTELSNTTVAPNTEELRHIWSSAIAGYGWTFYLSKIYELVDTLIVIAQGKPPTFFQTYHHVGAIVTIWSALVYRVTPVWSYILMNSGIHALMYTYYALALFKVQIPKQVKMTLTILQIVQLTVALSYGIISLIASYEVPYRSKVDGKLIKVVTKPCSYGLEDKFVLSVGVGYIGALLALFARFFYKTYRGSPVAKEARKIQ